MRIYFLIGLLIFMICQTHHIHSTPTSREVGMFNVYFSLDESLGYVDVRDDFAEVYAVGCNLATHYFVSEYGRRANGRRFWAGLNRWLKRNPERAAQLRDWKRNYGPSLGWTLFFWSTYMQEAYTQTNGGLKVLIGEMYAIFGAQKDWEGLKKFVQAISKFEQENCPGAIAGWYIAEEPNGSRKRYSPKIANQVIEHIKTAEPETPHKIYVDVSTSKRRKRVAPFLKNVDVIMLSPEAYIWARRPPIYVEEAQYERIHHIVRAVRGYAASVGNSKAKIQVVLQTYDWNKSGPLQPNHIDMHQQVRYALQQGWVDRGVYGYKPRWVEPPDGIWFWWWHDCKFKKRKAGRITTINRWDDGTEGSWAEAIKTELNNQEKAVVIHGKENWSGTVHIIGDVIVAEDGILTIEPGTTVKFAVRDHFRGGEDVNRCELIVRGQLIAKGNNRLKVTLTSDSMNRKQSPRPRPGKVNDWYGIRKEGKKAKIEMENYRIRFARVKR